MKRQVAVVCSVLNEQAALDGLIDSLLAQTHPPDEIIIVDGGSNDGTIEKIRERVKAGAPIRLVLLPGSNISQARNAGIAASCLPFIAVTDCGVRLEPYWLGSLTAHFDGMDGRIDVVSGFFRADPRSTFEIALGATTLVDERDIDPATFLPSSRSVAFTRQAWASVGGYPEWLEHSEDVVFDLALRKSGAKFVFEPKALVHFRPRSSWKSFALQYFRYARGDGKASLWWNRHIARYLIYFLGPLVLVMARRHPRLYLAAIVGCCCYLASPYRRLLAWLSPLPWTSRLAALSYVPLIRFVGDIAKMLGFPVGVWLRLTRRDHVRASICE